jgi:transcriptional regulator
MKRRDLLAGLALSAVGARGQQSVPASLYIPKAQRVEDLALLHDFMDEFSFVDLITAAPAIHITHIPVVFDRTAGPNGTIYGHIAHNNPQSETIAAQSSAVVVFRGPHAYISPTWYTTTQAVPTWNFAAVHASGKLKAVTDQTALKDLLGHLIAKFEDRYSSAPFELKKLPESFVSAMLGGIVGFELPIESLEGKFKLGQDRTPADKAGILSHLQTEKPDRSIYEFTAAYYARLAKEAAKQPGD